MGKGARGSVRDAGLYLNICAGVPEFLVAALLTNRSASTSPGPV